MSNLSAQCQKQKFPFVDQTIKRIPMKWQISLFSFHPDSESSHSALWNYVRLTIQLFNSKKQGSLLSWCFDCSVWCLNPVDTKKYSVCRLLSTGSAELLALLFGRKIVVFDRNRTPNLGNLSTKIVKTKKDRASFKDLRGKARIVTQISRTILSCAVWGRHSGVKTRGLRVSWPALY